MDVRSSLRQSQEGFFFLYNIGFPFILLFWSETIKSIQLTTNRFSATFAFFLYREPNGFLWDIRDLPTTGNCYFFASLRFNWDEKLIILKNCWVCSCHILNTCKNYVTFGKVEEPKLNCEFEILRRCILERKGCDFVKEQLI